MDCFCAGIVDDSLVCQPVTEQVLERMQTHTSIAGHFNRCIREVSEGETLCRIERFHKMNDIVAMTRSVAAVSSNGFQNHPLTHLSTA